MASFLFFFNQSTVREAMMLFDFTEDIMFDAILFHVGL
jgi:hypothetical protein